MPQYRYAHDATGRVVDVLELPQDREEVGGPFLCIGCGNPLIAKTRGEKRQKHFAHKVAVTCSPETYLHRLAKQTFHRVYLRCIEENEPFTVELAHPKVCPRFRALLGHRCTVGQVERAHDLTAYYDGIREEMRDGAFIPDLLLFNTRDESKKIYVEVAVTHFLSDEKRESDNRIIEIPVETEADIEKIKARRLTPADASFVNFGRATAPVADADCECAGKVFYCFLVYKSGKSFLDQATLAEIQSKLRRYGESIVYARLVPTPLENVLMEPGQVFTLLLQEAHERGFPVRNCLLCRYAGQNWDWFLGGMGGASSSIFCKAKRQPCGTNAAANCEMFRLPLDGKAPPR